jgi:hypothetical protein
MSVKKMLIVLVMVVAASVAAFSLIASGGKELRLVPKPLAVKETTAISGTEVGTGWSGKDSPEEAVKEAVEMALTGKKNRNPDFAIVFPSSGSDLSILLPKLKEVLGGQCKIYGGTSDSRGVMTEKGFVKAAKKAYAPPTKEGRALAIMTVVSQDIGFGVGSAEFSGYPSVQEASRTALLNAIRSAKKAENELPKVVLVTPTKGEEEEVLEGIEGVVGKDHLVLGGTAGGPDSAVFGEDRVYSEGLSLAVIYTDLPVGWTFEGGFDVRTPESGIVTKVDGQTLLEIDHRPALVVYNEWLGGEINRLHGEVGDPGTIRELLTLHPLYRKYTSPSGQDYFLFSHPWAQDSTLQDKSIRTSTKIQVGERIFISHGTWETLLNRVGELPRNAKMHGAMGVDEGPILGIGYMCAGVMGIIPEKEREKMPLLVGYANNDAPFIASFTSGEQGHLPGVGNKHGNLLTSFLVIGKP